MTNRVISVKTAYGSADFCNDEGSKDDTLLDNIGSRVYVGNSIHGTRGRFIFECQRHQLTIAPTRAGKGACQIIPNVLCYQGSIIVVDPTGEITYLTAERRREMGQKVYILDPFDEIKHRFGNREMVDTLNPLSSLNSDDPNYADNVAYFGEALIKNRGRDPHWDNAARELVAGLISYEIETRGKKASLGHVREVLTEPFEKLVETLINSGALPEGSLARKKLQRYSDINIKAENREFRSILSTAVTQLSFLDSRTLVENIETSSCNIEEMFEESGASIFLVLPPDKLQTCARWLRLIISMIILAIARNKKRLKYPINFYLDEMGTIGRLSLIANSYGLMAGLQMRIWGFLQTLGQLKRDYPRDWEVIIGNCDFITFFNILDQETVSYLVDCLGEETMRIYDGSETEFQKIATGQQSFLKPIKIAPRKLLDTAGVRYHPQDQGILIRRGKPLIFEKPAYYKDPILSIRARKHPHFR